MTKTRGRAHLAALVVGLMLSAIAPAARAAADAQPSVTLSAAPATVDYGDEVTLSGAIAPAAGGETVSLEDPSGDVLVQATTDPAGAYSVDYAPQANVTVHAAWKTVSSPSVDLGVRAVVTARLTGVRLFDMAAVRGRVSPPRAGSEMTVTLSRGGRIVTTKRAIVSSAGVFSTTIPIEEPGTYRARATLSADDLLQGSAVGGPRTTPLPSLHIGSNGTFVRLLEQRLQDIHYRLTGVNQRYDFRTGDAVMAFHKVQRMARTTTIDASTWRALADPFVPKPRSKSKGFHIEIDQSRQVLYIVESGDITNILHVSTGKPSTPTHDGTFHVFRKLAGYSGGGLYYPSYFDGGRALHGWPDVPNYAASHGCVRIPFWNAQWIFGLAKLGTRVMIYH